MDTAAGAHPGRIIIADDVPHVRAAMRMMLTLALGVEIVGEAGTARELLDVLTTTPADIIIVDRELTGLDDDAVVEEIRRHAPESRILLCSVFDRCDGTRACPLEADFTLSKSRGPEHWLQALNAMLKERPPGIINVVVEHAPAMRVAMHHHAPADASDSIPRPVDITPRH